ncbi:MAG: hypothetical protein M3N51_06975 [Actinomycetota bacterium]|nr:hypothetical protein [Actinomycetota bacterium]
MGDEVVYRSEVRVERLQGPVRRCWVPAREEPITFGVHDEVAEHYGLSPEDYGSDTTTLDYVVAAAVG